MQRRYLKMRVCAVFTIGFFVSLTYAFVLSVILLSAFFPSESTLLFRTSNGSPTSSVSTASSFGECFAHNMWNLFLELLFLEQTGGIIVLYVEEIDLANIALSYLFAFDLLRYKEGGHDDYE